jgi:hypothetical protein
MTEPTYLCLAPEILSGKCNGETLTSWGSKGSQLITRYECETASPVQMTEVYGDEGKKVFDWRVCLEQLIKEE